MTAFEQENGHELMQTHAFSLGQARVYDLFQSRVAEPPLLGFTRSRVADDDLRLLQLLELVSGRFRVHHRQLDHVEPVPEHRRAPGQLAEPHRHRVEPGADHRLHSGRHGPAALAIGTDARRHQHSRGLDDEVGIPAGAFRDLQRLDFADAAAARVAGKLDRLVARERVQADQHRVAGARTPRRPLLEQLVAGERDDERPARTLTARRDAFDEIQHRGLEALRVLKHDEHRMVAGQTLDHGDEPGLHLVDERGLVPALAEREEQG